MVRWALDDARDRFTLVWQESGLQLPEARPARSGFGFELLERALPYELRGETSIHLERSGICFTLVMPAQGNVVLKPPGA